MEIHQVHGKQGLQWILSGFYLFRKAPLAWVFVCFTLMLIAMAMSFIPLLGKFVFTLISPAFLAGIMLGCKDMEQGKPIELKHLFIAFKTNPAPLITIGGIYLIGQILIIGLVMLIGGSQMTDMLLYEKRVDESELMGVMSSMLTSSLIALTLSIPLMMASWFSPLLVIFHNVPPIAAMQRSFFACLKNFIPF
ncbi:MAG: BPSS1780 family membrane protein, partial [Nitrosomonas sp.]|nr:BPSS1780 family membrane protein [Nitrosomonas sp.]